MKRIQEEVRIKGQTRLVDAFEIEGKVITVAGSLLKTARIKDEWYGDAIGDAEAVLGALREGRSEFDLFTFVQRVPDTKKRYEYKTEWVPMAVVPVQSFQNWWEKQIPGHVRKNVRKAQKRGVTCRVVKFDDDVARGIWSIYNECPVRQGKPFWHYGKDFETVRREAATFPDKSEFIGAYLDSELIGFIKMIYLENCVSTLHVISMIKHRDKSPTNALIAKAVEECATRKIAHFHYGEWIDGSLGDFKRYSGFEKMPVPRYFVPLTPKGRLALRCNLHHGPGALIPEGLRPALIAARRRWNARKMPHDNLEL